MSALRRPVVLILAAILCFSTGASICTGCSVLVQGRTSVAPGQTGAPPMAPATQPAKPIRTGSVRYRVVEQAAPLGDQPKEPVYAVITGPADWETLSGRVPAQVIQKGLADAASSGDGVNQK